MNTANQRDHTEVPVSEWKWFGAVGHFDCGRWCRFHLTTQVGKVLVSTVGELVLPYRSKGSEIEEAKWLKDNWPGDDIGCDGAKYQTMVFLASKPCTDKGCNCGLPEIVPRELDTRHYRIAGDATRGHMELCKKWAAAQPASCPRV